MVGRVAATPLLAIDAVAIDTETTGLDPGSARAIELAAVRIVRGQIDESDVLRSLIRPDIPIPAAATRIHGIDDAAVAAAPPFAQAWPGYATFIGNSMIVGHSIGFDLAIFGQECRRSGIVWTPPPGLDTRLLAQIVSPNLADYSLDHLAGWLGVEAVNRHSALGDAITAAQIYQKLVPMLRERGIRTVAEAIRASKALTDTIEQQNRAGWVDTTEAAGAHHVEDAGPRIDSYPYRHRISEIMRAPARFVAPKTLVGSALRDMTGAQISSLFVADSGRDGSLAEETGIVTERDILRAIARDGADALLLPVDRVMSRPLHAVNADAYAYVAIGRMNRLGIRHLGVVDESGRVVGALSSRNLLHLRAEGAVLLGDEISQASNAADLARCWAVVPTVVAGLRTEGFSGRDVAEIVSRQLGAMTRRAAVLAERLMKDSGQGAPPVPYAVAVLGSAGRGESLLAADQDNALVFADGALDGPVDRWFAALADHIARILHEAGIPYCKGGVMAKNPVWRGSMSTWQRRVDGWLDRSNPADLLNVDIFFDLRGVHGDARLADRLWRYAFDAANGRADFAKLLAEAIGPAPAVLGWFGRFKTEQGRIDLKKAGLFGIVTTARALAICHHVVERSTAARLEGLKALNLGSETDIDALNELHGVFVDLILDQQLHDIRQGIGPTNSVAPERLGSRDRERLRAALASVAHLDEMLRDLLFKA